MWGEAKNLQNCQRPSRILSHVSLLVSFFSELESPMNMDFLKRIPGEFGPSKHASCIVSSANHFGCYVTRLFIRTCWFAFWASVGACHEPSLGGQPFGIPFVILAPNIGCQIRGAVEHFNTPLRIMSCSELWAIRFLSGEVNT